jgi:hypothetical protein
MKITTRIEYVNRARRTFDKHRKIGVEINVRDRKYYHRVDVETTNGEQKPNRIETTYIPRLGSKWLMKPLINWAFRKIKHRYIEWGLPRDIQFPWKEETP